MAEPAERMKLMRARRRAHGSRKWRLFAGGALVGVMWRGVAGVGGG